MGTLVNLYITEGAVNSVLMVVLGVIEHNILAYSPFSQCQNDLFKAYIKLMIQKL